MLFENKIVLVTGAARGIGAACVASFVEQGAKVVVNYLSSESEAQSLGERYGLNVMLVQGDMSEESDIKRLFDEVESEWGTVDVLVNNAGIVNRQKFPELDGEGFMNSLKVNTVGPYLVAREFATRLGDAQGSIVNLGSMRVPCPTSVDYSASKAAVHNMTISLAKAVGPNIRVNAVAPGFTETAMHGGNIERLEAEAEKSVLKRYSQPLDLADSVVFLASDKARSITGQVLLVDNGRSLFH